MIEVSGEGRYREASVSSMCGKYGISLASLLGKHASLVICVQVNAIHGEIHITVTLEMSLLVVYCMCFFMVTQPAIGAHLLEACKQCRFLLRQSHL